MATESKKIQFIVILSALFVVATSVAITLWVMTPATKTSDALHQNITFTDAALTCEKRISDDFNRDIVKLHIDSHSSHFDETHFRYKLFYHLDLREKKKIMPHYVNCFVRASSGDVSEMIVLQRVEEDGSLVPKRRFDSIKWPK